MTKSLKRSMAPVEPRTTLDYVVVHRSITFIDTRPPATPFSTSTPFRSSTQCYRISTNAARLGAKKNMAYFEAILRAQLPGTRY